VEELRKRSIENLDDAFFMILKGKFRFAIQKNRLVLKETVAAYNHLIMTGETDNDRHS